MNVYIHRVRIRGVPTKKKKGRGRESEELTLSSTVRYLSPNTQSGRKSTPCSLSLFMLTAWW